MMVRYPKILDDIKEVISSIRPTRSKISNEKTMKGRLLISPKDMNAQFKKCFNDLSYTEARANHKVKICGSDDFVNGYKQIDFVKDRILIEVQLGKYAFMFYDLAKFQYFFNENKAEVGVEIVPSHSLHKQMSTGVSYGDQLISDIERLKRHFPSVPVLVILINE